MRICPRRLQGRGEKKPDVLPRGKGGGAGRVRVKAGCPASGTVGLPPPPALGTKEGHGRQAAHGPGWGRAGGGSRLPPGSTHRPSVAARPPALNVLRPHRSWTARAVSVGRVAGEVGGERVGCWAAVAPMPVLRSGPGPWIPGPESPGPILSLGADFSQGQWRPGKPSALGEGHVREQRKKGTERNPLQHTRGAEGGRQTEEPSSQRKVCGGLSFSHLEAAAEQAPPPLQPRVLGVLSWGP